MPTVQHFAMLSMINAIVCGLAVATLAYYWRLLFFQRREETRRSQEIKWKVLWASTYQARQLFGMDNTFEAIASSVFFL